MIREKGSLPTFRFLYYVFSFQDDNINPMFSCPFDRSYEIEEHALQGFPRAILSKLSNTVTLSFLSNLPDILAPKERFQKRAKLFVPSLMGTIIHTLVCNGGLDFLH